MGNEGGISLPLSHWMETVLQQHCSPLYPFIPPKHRFSH